MSQALVFPDQASADAFAAAVNAKLYPTPKDAVDVGEGIHVPAALQRTTMHVQAKRHPTLALACVVVDAPVQDLIATAKVAAPQGTALQTLDATWAPAPVAVAPVGEVKP